MWSKVSLIEEIKLEPLTTQLTTHPILNAQFRHKNNIRTATHDGENLQEIA